MKIVKKLLSYMLSFLFYVFFSLTLLFFHAIQVFCLHVLGRKTHKISVDWLNYTLLKCLIFLGGCSSFENEYTIPDDKPIIIVSNHQSMYDVCLISWYLRKYAPKFVSKMELGKGIPSISYNLRNGGSVLIQRDKPRQALPAMAGFAKQVATDKTAAVIFPEGTRSKDGMPKPFAINGLKTLFKYMPDAVVVPVSINNSWCLMRNGMFPLEIGLKLTLKVQQPITLDEMPTEQIIQTIEKQVIAGIEI